MVPFRYFGFWDAPRYMLVRYKGHLFWLQSIFDERLDDYPDTYSVYLLPASVSERQIESGQTPPDTPGCQFLGELPIRSVRFDRTKRKKLDPSVLAELLEKSEKDVPHV